MYHELWTGAVSRCVFPSRWLQDMPKMAALEDGPGQLGSATRGRPKPAAWIGGPWKSPTSSQEAKDVGGKTSCGELCGR